MSIFTDDIDWDKWNYCELGHYEEFEVNDPTWPKCMNRTFLDDLEKQKGLDCE